MLRGLDSDDLGATPAERRRGLAALSDAALGERLAGVARASRSLDAAPIARAAGLPLGEVVASPFALRMCALGVEAGASSRHRELRRHVDWTESIDPAVGDPDHDVWERGALKTGKYQGFTAESPVAIYDPAHVSKWGPHEMLHRAVGYLYRPGLSRWELYLGARLNELLPVTTFYGAEQAMRLDEGAFDRAAAGRRPRARAQDARWRVEDDDALAARARRAAPVFREGLQHLERELAAIDEELLRGVRVRAVHPFLDTSSDATAYVVGHHTRLSQAAVERVLAPHGEPDVGAYRDRVEACFDRLLFETLDGSVGDARATEARDLLLRAAHLGEGVEVDLEPLFDERDPDVVRARLPDCIGEEEAALILEDGTARGLALDQLTDGLAHVMPRCVDLDAGLVEALASDPALLDRGPLHERALRFIEAGADAGLTDLARLEAAIAAAERDDAVERLAVAPDRLPDDLGDGVVFANRALRRLDLAHDVLTAHAEGGRPAQAAQTLLVVGYDEAVSVVPIPPDLADSVEALKHSADDPDLPEEWTRELLHAGVLAWRPA